ncbi:MAG: hypothetical protein ACTHNS_13250 [Marmoricola sp.]
MHDGDTGSRTARPHARLRAFATLAVLAASLGWLYDVALTTPLSR